MTSPRPVPRDALVSIITPTLDMCDRLKRCIDAVHAQTYGRIEHVVVDGGSSDGTIAYLESEGRVRWISEKDDGQSDALNKGFGMASGDVLTWLNADDTLDARAVEAAVEALRREPGAGLAYGDVEIVMGDRRWVEKPPATLTLDSFRRGNVISQPGTFFTRWAFDAVGGQVDPEFSLTMDFELWLRFATAGIEAVYVPRTLAHFEIHSESKTGSQSPLRFAEEDARALRKHGMVHEAAMAIDRWWWNQTVDELEQMLRNGRRAEARRFARDRLARMRPVGDRVRLFLWLGRVAPWAARRVVRRRTFPSRRA